MLTIREKDGDVQFAVRVFPGASKNEVAGIQDGALKVRLTAPPVEGKANLGLRGVPGRPARAATLALAITSGEKSRKKTVTVEGLARGELQARLKGLLEP